MNKILLSVTAVAAMAFGSASAAVSLDTDCFSVQIDDAMKTYSVTEKCKAPSENDGSFTLNTFYDSTGVVLKELRVYSKGNAEGSLDNFATSEKLLPVTSNLAYLNTKGWYYYPPTKEIFILNDPASGSAEVVGDFYAENGVVKTKDESWRQFALQVAPDIWQPESEQYLLDIGWYEGEIRLINTAWGTPYTYREYDDMGVEHIHYALKFNTKGMCEYLRASPSPQVALSTSNYVQLRDKQGNGSGDVEKMCKDIY